MWVNSTPARVAPSQADPAPRALPARTLALRNRGSDGQGADREPLAARRPPRASHLAPLSSRHLSGLAGTAQVSAATPAHNRYVDVYSPLPSLSRFAFAGKSMITRRKRHPSFILPEPTILTEGSEGSMTRSARDCFV